MTKYFSMQHAGILTEKERQIILRRDNGVWWETHWEKQLAQYTLKLLIRILRELWEEGNQVKDRHARRVCIKDKDLERDESIRVYLVREVLKFLISQWVRDKLLR